MTGNFTFEHRGADVEKLDKVIKALEQCHRDIMYRDCDCCDYASAGSECERCLMEDALEYLKQYHSSLNKRCENCANYVFYRGRFRCNHECIDFDFDPGDTWLDMRKHDSCSYWKPKEGAV